MEDMKNKNSFLITCMTCIVLLLVMCYFGINSVSNKGTLAADATYTCASGYNVIDNNGSPYCCPSSYGKNAEIISHNGSYYCVPSDVEIYASGNSDPVCKYNNWLSIKLSESEIEAFKSITIGGQMVDYFLKNNSSVANKFRVSYGSGWTPILNTNGLGNCRMPANIDDTIECSVFESTISKGCVVKATLTQQNDVKVCFKYSATNIYGQKHDKYEWLSRADNVNKNGYEIQSSLTTETACINANEHGCYYCSDNKYYWSAAFYINSSNCSKQSSITTETACKAATGNPGAGTTTCPAGEYYKGQGQCAECLANYYCPGGTFNSSDSSRDGINACPSGTTSPAGSDSESDCKSSGGSSGGTSSETHRVTFKDHDGTTLGSDTCTTTTGSCKVNALSTNPSRTGYTFDGWSYGGNSCSKLWHNTLTVSGSISVYACYTENQPSGGGTGTTPQSYTISYNANGGTGTMASHTCTVGSTCTIKGNEFVRSGHKFMGWTTNSNGTKDGYGWTGWSGTWKAEYANGSHGISNNKLILYAMWDKTSTNQNTDTNPQTGEITIFLTWIVGIAAIVYSVWYFKNMKHINN